MMARGEPQATAETPELAKVANLEVDAKSYWLYTNDPFDNRKRREAFETFGFEKALEVLAQGQSGGRASRCLATALSSVNLSATIAHDSSTANGSPRAGGGGVNKVPVVLRAATVDDEAFVNDLLFATMHDYVEATWPNDPVAQRHCYEINKFVAATERVRGSLTRILLVSGKAVGRLTTTPQADCLFIDELHVLPEYQRQGIGQHVIEQVLKQAREKGIPVRLTVLVVNREAQRLYLKMGFTVTAEKDHRLHMERSFEKL